MDLFKLVAGWGLLTYLEYVFQLLLILIRPCGIVYYKIFFDKEVHLKMLNLISSESVLSGETIIRGNKRVPSGYFLSLKAIGFVDIDAHYMESSKITIITTEKYYNYLTRQLQETTISIKEDEAEERCECDKICVFNRCGRFEDLIYSRVRIQVKDLKPFESQAPIVHEIVNTFKETQVVRVFIEGISGSGKSSIGYCVAKALHGKFTHSFNPTDPGDTFGNVISTMNYEESDNPNIIVLEEVDVLIDKIHNGKIMQNERISTMIKDKTNWNSFLDDMTFYKNTILILTSNTSKKQIDKLDTAYLRKGRIDLYYEMNEPIPI